MFWTTFSSTVLTKIVLESFTVCAVCLYGKLFYPGIYPQYCDLVLTDQKNQKTKIRNDLVHKGIKKIKLLLGLLIL